MTAQGSCRCQHCTLHGRTRAELPRHWSCPCVQPSSPPLRHPHQERHLSTQGSSSWPLILDHVPSSLLLKDSMGYLLPYLPFSLYFPLFLFNHKKLARPLSSYILPLSLSSPPLPSSTCPPAIQVLFFVLCAFRAKFHPRNLSQISVLLVSWTFVGFLYKHPISICPFFFWPYRVACGILVPQPRTEPVPPCSGSIES